MSNVQEQIAHSFLRALGAPDTPLMRAAVKAWLRKEGITSVKRNNPWNLHQGAACGGANDAGKFCERHVLPGQIGVVNVGPGDKNVAVFKTLDAGVAASAGRLQMNAYGYPRVVKYARRGDPVNFLNALALSSWSYSRYGIRGGGPNGLILIYNNITGQHADPHSYLQLAPAPPRVGEGGHAHRPQPGSHNNAGGGIPDNERERGPEYLAAWGGIVNLPVGHIVTQADVDTMMKQLIAAGFFKDDTTGQAEANTRAILETAIGKEWNKSLQDSLQLQFFGAANEAGGLGAAVGSIAATLGALTNPANWIRILALIAGGALTAYGGYSLLRAS